MLRIIIFICCLSLSITSDLVADQEHILANIDIKTFQKKPNNETFAIIENLQLMHKQKELEIKADKEDFKNTYRNIEITKDEELINDIISESNKIINKTLEENISIVSENKSKNNKKNQKLKELEGYELYIFVSNSLPNNTLTNYLEESKKYELSPIMRGFIDNSKPIKSSEALISLAKTIENGFLVNPLLFEKFNIQTVPSFVLVKKNDLCLVKECSPKFDKISGNISIKRAIDRLLGEGELANSSSNL